MKILIVEDEPLVAGSLRFLLELEDHEVTGIADDLESSLAAVESAWPELALVDLGLARGTSGAEVAAALRRRNIACIFVSGNAPGRPQPELALGCLFKPYTDKALLGAIRVADAFNNGLARPTDTPEGLDLY